MPLLNGRDLTGWHAIGGSEWEIAGGVLHNRKSGGNLVTDRTFDDFTLHAEFRYPKGSNSGIYLRGRYEVQIIDLDEDRNRGGRPLARCTDSSRRIRPPGGEPASGRPSTSRSSGGS